MKKLHQLFLDLVAQYRDYRDHICISFDDGSVVVCRTYADVLETSEQISSSLLSNNPSLVVAFSAPVTDALPCLILGILRSGSAFLYLDPQDFHKAELNLRLLKQQQVTHLFVDINLLKHQWLAENFEIAVSSEVLKLNGVVLLKAKTDGNCHQESMDPENLDDVDKNLAYVITTSGSTGVPKTVRVPHDAIVPNILDLKRIFAIRASDRIFAASPLTFDPSIVEMFLALSSGARLVLTPGGVKMNPDRLLDVLCNRQHVTVLQATPTLIRNFGPDQLRSTLLSNDTSLRLLAFGGESSPDWGEIIRWRSKQNMTEMFNLYGVTEMSCWATCHRFYSYIDIGNDVPIGRALSHTELVVKNGTEVVKNGEGTLFLRTDVRSCKIYQNNDVTICSEVDTGDIVHVTPPYQWCIETAVFGSDHEIRYPTIIYRGRRDHVIKRNGKKIDIISLQKTIRKEKEVEDVVVLLSDNQLLAFVQTSEDDEQNFGINLMESVNRKVQEYTKIDDVIIVDRIPMTSHGKVDRVKLLETHKNQIPRIPYTDDNLNKEWLTVFPFLSSAEPQHQFLTLGGDSIAAVRFAERIQQLFGVHIPELMDITLTKNYEDIKSAIRNAVSKPNDSDHIARKRSSTDATIKDATEKSWMVQKSKRRKIKPLISVQRCGKITNHNSDDPAEIGDITICGLESRWACDTGKCVDASPLLVHDGKDAVVYIGSHSHKFFAINAAYGHVVWQTLLGDRVESSACLSSVGKYIIVGCYDKRIYVLERLTGAITWYFQTEAMVKSSPCVDDVTGYVVCGSHDHHLYALDVEKQSLVWKVDIDGASVFSSPIVCYRPRHQVYAATLAGTLAAVNPKTGAIVWTHKFGTPVFSSPAVNWQKICVGCADGKLYALNHNGDTLWSYATDAPIFSSPTIVPRTLPRRHVIPAANQVSPQVTSDATPEMTSDAMWSTMTSDDMPQMTSHAMPQMTSDAMWSTMTSDDMPQMTSDAMSQMTSDAMPQMTSDAMWSTMTSDDMPQMTSDAMPQMTSDVMWSTMKSSVIFGSHDQHIYCVSDEGRLVWKTKLDSIIFSSPFIGQYMANGNVRPPRYVYAATSQTLYILNSQSGSILHSVSFKGETFSSPVVRGNSLFVGCRDNNVYAYTLKE